MRLLARLAFMVLLAGAPSIASAASQYPPAGFPGSLAGMNVGGSNIQSVRCNPDPDGITCHVIIEQAAYLLGYVTLATATTFKTAAGGPATVLLGIQNVSNTAQTVTCDAYDNATAATGQKVFSGAAFGATQQITFPAPGLPLANGLTVLCSGAPTGSMQFQYR